MCMYAVWRCVCVCVCVCARVRACIRVCVCIRKQNKIIKQLRALCFWLQLFLLHIFEHRGHTAAVASVGQVLLHTAFILFPQQKRPLKASPPNPSDFLLMPGWGRGWGGNQAHWPYSLPSNHIGLQLVINLLFWFLLSYHIDVMALTVWGIFAFCPLSYILGYIMVIVLFKKCCVCSHALLSSVTLC